MHKYDAFSSFTDLEHYLEGLGLFRMKPGLGRIRGALGRLGLARPPYRVVQVVGTNGKGSTSTMLERLAREHGLKTGLHTSPHFLSIRERVRVNGSLLPEERWTALGNVLLRQSGEELSYFEFVTCLAVLAFAEAGVDLAVMESGLGGAFDATTALEADLVLFTPIGLDHQAVLGNSLREIAADKAGAIRPGKPALSGPQKEEALPELIRTARERSAPLRLLSFADRLPPAVEHDSLPLRLAGEHQKDNARLALAAWRTLLDPAEVCSFPAPALAAVAAKRQAALEACAPVVDSGSVALAFADMEARALSLAWLPGRMQYLPAHAPAKSGFAPCELGWPPLLLDGAHNSHGLAALGLSLARRGAAPLAVVFSCLADKDIDQIIPHLRALATGLIVIPPVLDNPRAMDPAELASLIGVNAVPVKTLREALETAARHMAVRMPEIFDPAYAKAENYPLLVCGSLYLLGQIYAFLPEALSG